MGTQTLVPNQYRLHKWDGPLDIRETGGAMVTGNIAVIPPDDADVHVESLSITENGTYTAPEGTAYSPVTVNVAGGGGSFEPYGWCTSEYYPAYVAVFPHGSAYSHKGYAQGKLYNDTEVYTYNNYTYTTLANKYTEGFITTSGNDDLDAYTMLTDVFTKYYLPIEPLGNENPSSEGWYEQYDHEGTLDLRQTSDTSVVAGKIYYKEYDPYSDSLLYVVFWYDNKLYGLTTASSDTFIEIPVQP